MIRKVIGIISYLPDNRKTRSNRFTKLNQLISKCNELFNLPILIIAQNYNKAEIDSISSVKNITMSLHDKLGITGARKQLRKEFLESDHDYLIMLDDDCTVDGNETGVKRYFDDIDKHPEGFGIFQLSLLKLFAISKSLYSQVEFPDVNPEDGEGFEDRVFVHGVLEKYYSKYKYQFTDTVNLTQTSISTKDPNTTWYKGQNLDKMNNNTSKYIREGKVTKIKKLKKVIGIVSYLPEADSDRASRCKRLTNLILKINELWPWIDIMIIAQNWKDFTLPTISNKIIIDKYEKLGILKARNTLREKFIKSDYDYIITMDDDAFILGIGIEYMNEIDEHPNMVGIFRYRNCPLTMLAISKEIFTKYPYPATVSVEEGGMIEDDTFIATLFVKCPEKLFEFSHTDIEEIGYEYVNRRIYKDSNFAKSTWDWKANWNGINNATRSYLNQIGIPNYYEIVTPKQLHNIVLINNYLNNKNKSSDTSYIAPQSQYNSVNRLENTDSDNNTKQKSSIQNPSTVASYLAGWRW